MDSSIAPAQAGSSLAREQRYAPMRETADLRPLRKEVRGNRGNAQIDERVELSASDGTPCQPSQIAQIAGKVQRTASLNKTAELPVNGLPERAQRARTFTNESDSNRESGALIRAGVASSAVYNRGHRANALGPSAKSAGSAQTSKNPDKMIIERIVIFMPKLAQTCRNPFHGAVLSAAPCAC